MGRNAGHSPAFLLFKLNYLLPFTVPVARILLPALTTLRRISMTKLFVLITAVVGFAIAISCSNGSTANVANTANANVTTGKTPVPSATPPVPAKAASTATGQSDDLAKGQDLYVKNCANCH